MLALSLSLFQSCAQLREAVVDDEDEAVTEDAGIPAEPEEITGLPAWHDPLKPVQITGDSLIVSAAAVAADSSDAKAIAELTFAEYRNKGLTDILFLLLEEEGVDVLEESAHPGAEKERREMLIRLYATGNEESEPEHIPAGSRSVSWHSENGQVRCYIRQAYDKAELYEAMRMQIRQTE
ncbi:MAG: hypothetical protein EA363_08190 [Balneolaceae bacterium]|nr:MAG: hypothetical protein EA363_08190 [Balneolaceae bacterium]